ncbi:MAG: hypothetical protein GXP11_01305 [Gammaproteobacteria bacterium]|nr:hypothetical protein [Gammaproteobacteria bacterium]
MIKIIIIGTIMMLAVQACSLGSKPEKIASIPVWVSSPPADTSETIYGIGSGFSYDEAKETALKDITGKLITEISSQSKSEISQFNNSVSRSANQQISTRTIDTQLSDYKVLQSEKVGRELFMQISMSRRGFIKTTSSRLKEIDDKIRNTMHGLPGKTKLQQFIATRDLESPMSKARSLVLLLQAAGGKQNTDKYLSYYNKILGKSNSLLYAVQFNVSSSENLKGFAKHLVTLMHNEKISASVSDKKGADAYVQISGTVKSSVIFSQYISQLKIRIKISDKNKRVISVREYEASGSSPGDANAASVFAIENMGKKFKHNGVLESLGLVKNNA